VDLDVIIFSIITSIVVVAIVQVYGIANGAIVWLVVICLFIKIRD
jgi:hypothetical protein